MTAATVANMRAFEEANPRRHPNVERRRCFAFSPTTGETASATPGDYFWLGDDDPLVDEHGEPMVLAVSSVHYTDALTGEAI